MTTITRNFPSKLSARNKYSPVCALWKTIPLILLIDKFALLTVKHCFLQIWADPVKSQSPTIVNNTPIYINTFYLPIQGWVFSPFWMIREFSIFFGSTIRKEDSVWYHFTYKLFVIIPDSETRFNRVINDSIHLWIEDLDWSGHFLRKDGGGLSEYEYLTSKHGCLTQYIIKISMSMICGCVYLPVYELYLIFTCLP